MSKRGLPVIAMMISMTCLLQAAGVNKDALLNNIRETQDIQAGATLTVGDFKPSEVPGFSVAGATLTYQGYPPYIRKIYVSDDNRHYLMGDFGDINSNPDQDRIAKVDISQSPMLGEKKAPVTVIEFVDFECPFCKRAFDYQDDIMKLYAGKVRLVYKAYPLSFHPWAEPAAIAAQCAQLSVPKKFWGFYNDIFQHQDDISSAKDPSARLMELAKESGYSSKKFLSCYENKVSSPTVHKEIEEGQSAGINGTPGYMINGHLLSGADENTLRSRIDECLLGKHGKYNN